MENYELQTQRQLTPRCKRGADGVKCPFYTFCYKHAIPPVSFLKKILKKSRV
jgi:hypothetical protein